MTSGVRHAASLAGSRSDTSVPWGSTARTVSCAPTSSARSRMPRIPLESLAASAGRADAVVAHDQDHAAVVVRFERQRHATGARVPDHVGQALLGDAVDDELLLGREREVAREAGAGPPGRHVRRPSCTAPAGRSGARARPALPGAAAARSAGPPPPPPARPPGARSTSARTSSGARRASVSPRRISPVSSWPISSCSSRAMRRRSASWAASARRPLSRRSPSSRSSISLKASASATTSASPRRGIDPLAGSERVDLVHHLRERRAAARALAAGRRGRSAASRRTRQRMTASSVMRGRYGHGDRRQHQHGHGEADHDHVGEKQPAEQGRAVHAGTAPRPLLRDGRCDSHGHLTIVTHGSRIRRRACSLHRRPAPDGDSCPWRPHPDSRRLWDEPARSTQAHLAAHARRLRAARRPPRRLRRVRDRDLPELLRDARGFVASDAEEEIAQIREDHLFVETRIAHLEALLRDARVVADGEAPGIAFPGRVVEVEYTRSGKSATYRIAGTGGPGGPAIVSAGSPVGGAYRPGCRRCRRGGAPGRTRRRAADRLCRRGEAGRAAA